METSKLTNKEYYRLLGVCKKVIKNDNEDLAYELLHTSLMRYEERTTPERKKEIEQYGNKVGYIVRIVCNEVAQYYRKKNNGVIFYYEYISDELINYSNNKNRELDFDYENLTQLKNSSKRGFYLANLFEIYVECNCRILQVSNRTGINRQTLKNDIDIVKNYLKEKTWQDLENQED